MTFKTNKPLVVLIGPMGAGKTTVGKLLAQELGYQFTDSDKEIERRCGADIPWIFDVEGEDGFRNREVAVLEDLSKRANLVLATGGGAMMRQENRDFVTRTGFVVYLNTSVEQQYSRTHKDKNRPLLQGEEDAFSVLQRLMATRDPIYRAVADLTVETDKKPLKTIVRIITKALSESESYGQD